MSKITFQKPGNFIYPVPAVMVSLRDASGKSNIITIAWTGTICSDPPMAYISVRKSRASYPMLVESGEFVINLPSEELVRALDYCGVRSLDQVDKKNKKAAPAQSESSKSVVKATNTRKFTKDRKTSPSKNRNGKI